MAKIKHRVRKQLRQPDEFVVATGTVFTFAKTHKKPLIWSGVGLAVLILVVSYGTALVQRSKTTSYEKFLSSLDTSLSTPVQTGQANPFMMAPGGQATPAAAVDGSEGTRAEKVEEALSKAEAYLESNNKGKYGLMGKLNAASLYSEAAQYDKAEALYRSCIEQSRGKDENVEFLSLTGLAQIMENQNKFSEALAIYTQIKESGNQERASWAALNMGRVLAADGQTDKAKAVWQETLDNDPDSPHGDQIRLHISRI